MLDLFGLISGALNLLLQELFLALRLFVHEVALLDGFLVHLGHVAEEHGLLPDLAEALLKPRLLLVDLLDKYFTLARVLHLGQVSLDVLYVLLVCQHELFVFLVEEALKAEVHHVDGTLQVLY